LDRTGNFAVERSNVAPDNHDARKALGGGYPVARWRRARTSVSAEPWSNELLVVELGRQSLASAAIEAAWASSSTRDCRARADRRRTLCLGLAGLAEDHPSVRNVRGEGLFLDSI